MEAAARDPRYRPAPPSPPQRPAPAGNQPAGRPAVQRTPDADAESPPPARRPGRDLGHVATNNGFPVSPAQPPPHNLQPPMKRWQVHGAGGRPLPHDGPMRMLCAEMPEAADQHVDLPQFKPHGDRLSATATIPDLAQVLADMIGLRGTINAQATNSIIHGSEDFKCGPRALCVGSGSGVDTIGPGAVMHAVRHGAVWYFQITAPSTQRHETAMQNRTAPAAASRKGPETRRSSARRERARRVSRRASMRPPSSAESDAAAAACSQATRFIHEWLRGAASKLRLVCAMHIIGDIDRRSMGTLSTMHDLYPKLAIVWRCTARPDNLEDIDVIQSRRSPTQPRVKFRYKVPWTIFDAYHHQWTIESWPEAWRRDGHDEAYWLTANEMDAYDRGARADDAAQDQATQVRAARENYYSARRP